MNYNQATEKLYVFISNGSGGIATFQSNLINFLSEAGKTSLIIDVKKNETYPNVKNKKVNKIYFSDVLYNPINTIRTLFKIKKKYIDKEIIFVISNPIILSIYFPVKSKIVLVFHSHINKINFFTLIFCFICSLFSIFLDKVIFVSKYTKFWWQKYFFFTRFSDNQVLYNLINTQNKFKNKKLKSSKINIGIVGRLNKDKGIVKLFDLIKNLNDKRLRYLIFGKGDSIDHKLYKNVKFFGWVKKSNIYKKIDILLVTSKIENCPYNVLESKSFGVPCISMANGGIREIIKNKSEGILLRYEDDYTKVLKSIDFIIKKYNFFSKRSFISSRKFDIKKNRNRNRLFKIFFL